MALETTSIDRTRRSRNRSWARLVGRSARVDERCRQIGQQIADHDGDRRDQGDADDDRDVDPLDRLPGQLADAGPAAVADRPDAGHPAPVVRLDQIRFAPDGKSARSLCEKSEGGGRGELVVIRGAAWPRPFVMRRRVTDPAAVGR